uniref:Uncharacterized protein n=1 Tax=Anguilla anguilla TaxID=7936 RepID=A0A0E9VK72_ANGAN
MMEVGAGVGRVCVAACLSSFTSSFLLFLQRKTRQTTNNRIVSPSLHLLYCC